MELSTPTFITEYDTRPNRLFIEYLNYPKEVLSMLWEGYLPTVATGVFFLRFTDCCFRLVNAPLVTRGQARPLW